MSQNFVSLHVHTYFSLLDGLSSPKELIARAKELGQPAIAITDHGVMHGSIELYREALKEGLKPIIGTEGYVVHKDTTEHLKAFVLEGDGDYKVKDKYHQLLLAINPVGYRNLCKLTSLAHLTEGRGTKNGKSDTSTKSKSWFTLEELAQYSEGVITTSGCMAGIIPQALKAGDTAYAEKMARWYQSVFGNRFYIEIQDHGADDGSDYLNELLVGLADKLNIEVVATADNHYTCERDKTAHDALLCINTGKLLSDEKRMRYEGCYWLPTGDEMVARLSKYLPTETAVRAVQNTVAIAERVEDYQLKGEPTPPKFTLPEDYDNPDDYLEDLAYEGLRKRFYGIPPQNYVDRLQLELDVFRDKNLAEYFLVVGDICRFCREQSIMVGPGRGSAGGSLVAYSLQITNIDPIHFGLIFSRFINVERMSYPDIDLDIDKERRHEVVEYLCHKYGSTQVAQIATFNRMVSASALKDTGRVLNVNYHVANELSTRIPVVRGKPAKISQIIKERDIFPDFYDAYQVDQRVMSKEGYENISFKDWVDLAIGIEGTVKSVGIHAAGVVIGWTALDEIVPLMKSKDGGTVTQYSMEDLEFLGLLKMDLLGLKTLSVIRRTLESVKQLFGVEIDLESINLNDLHVLQSMVTGDNAGVFQFEADGAVRLLRQIKPTSIDDVSAITSLNRPGCLDLGMHTDYARRKAGLDRISYLVPDLEPILGFTYGLCVFQEQMLNICHKIAGWTLGKSDVARKACGKKRAEVIKPLEQDFIQGCANKWIDENVATELWEIVLASAGYTFNASHAYCYSVITMFTAWLKHYYKCAFMAALMSAEDDPDKLTQYLIKCKSYGFKLLPPDINQSGKDFQAVDDQTIRWGLRALKGLGDAAIDPIILERQLAPYESFTDFYSRTNLGSDALTALIKSGALDSLHPNRAEMIAYLEPLKKWRTKKKQQAGRATHWERECLKLSQVNVNELSQIQISKHLKRMQQVAKNYENANNSVLVLPAIPACKDWKLTKRLEGEKEVLGLFGSGHPLDVYPVGCVPFEQAEVKKVFVSTLQVNSAREANSKQGTMLYVDVEDRLGDTMTLKVFNKQYQEYGHLFKKGEHVSITANVQEWKGRTELILQVALKPTPPTGEQEAIVGAWEDDEF
jgi:DNA polymerase-3 subunit alpha